MRAVWREIEGGGFWDPIFIRHLNDWEVGEAVRLLSWLGPKKLYVEIDDMPRGWRQRMMFFSIKAYKVLEARSCIAFPLANIWGLCST